jgi:hypothetical protein
LIYVTDEWNIGIIYIVNYQTYINLYI